MTLLQIRSQMDNISFRVQIFRQPNIIRQRRFGLCSCRHRRYIRLLRRGLAGFRRLWRLGRFLRCRLDAFGSGEVDDETDGDAGDHRRGHQNRRLRLSDEKSRFATTAVFCLFFFLFFLVVFFSEGEGEGEGNEEGRGRRGVNALRMCFQLR